MFGYVLRVKQIAIADELASAAELVIGQTDGAFPLPSFADTTTKNPKV